MLCRHYRVTRRELFERFDSRDLTYEWVLHTKLIPLPNPARESAQTHSLLANAHFRSDDSWHDTEVFMGVDPMEEDDKALPRQPETDQRHVAALVHKLMGG